MFQSQVGVGSSATARQCFVENIRRFVNTNPQSNPEAYNLYNGLINLMGVVENLEYELAETKHQLALLRQQLQ